MGVEGGAGWSVGGTLSTEPGGGRVLLSFGTGQQNHTWSAHTDSVAAIHLRLLLFRRLFFLLLLPVRLVTSYSVRSSVCHICTEFDGPNAGVGWGWGG